MCFAKIGGVLSSPLAGGRRGVSKASASLWRVAEKLTAPSWRIRPGAVSLAINPTC